MFRQPISIPTVVFAILLPSFLLLCCLPSLHPIPPSRLLPGCHFVALTASHSSYMLKASTESPRKRIPAPGVLSGAMLLFSRKAVRQALGSTCQPRPGSARLSPWWSAACMPGALRRQQSSRVIGLAAVAVAVALAVQYSAQDTARSRNSGRWGRRSMGVYTEVEHAARI